MHVDTFEEVLYPETLATDMLDLAAVILVNGLHDQLTSSGDSHPNSCK